MMIRTSNRRGLVIGLMGLLLVSAVLAAESVRFRHRWWKTERANEVSVRNAKTSFVNPKDSGPKQENQPALPAQMANDSHVVAGGGGSSSGGSFSLDGTIGEVSAGDTLSGGTFSVKGGFWNTLQGAAATPTPTPTPTSTPNVTIGLSPFAVTESGATNLVFTFTRSVVTNSSLTVNFSIGGSATLGQDYTASTTGSVTITANSSSANVVIDPAADLILESDETVILTVTAGSGYNVGTPPAHTATGTITPDAPIVYTEQGNGSFAAAINSVTFVRGPFKLVDDHNFSSDHLTRVILITSPLGMTQQDLSANPGLLKVSVAGYANPLPIENVGTLTIAANPAFSVSYIVVRLPADLPNPSPGPNNLTLTVSMGSANSNVTTLSITP